MRGGDHTSQHVTGKGGPRLPLYPPPLRISCLWLCYLSASSQSLKENSECPSSFGSVRAVNASARTCRLCLCHVWCVLFIYFSNLWQNPLDGSLNKYLMFSPTTVPEDGLIQTETWVVYMYGYFEAGWRKVSTTNVRCFMTVCVSEFYYKCPSLDSRSTLILRVAEWASLYLKRLKMDEI